MNVHVVSRAIIVGLSTFWFIGCQAGEGRNHHEDDHHALPEDEHQKGPHGGRLFHQDGFGLEFTIYEPGIPPQSRVYFYQLGKPLDPKAVTLATELHRIDRVDTITYHAEDDYLVGNIVVEEPHSFEVRLRASYQGKNYFFSFSSFEGRTTISSEAMAGSGITIETVGGATIADSLVVSAKVVPDRTKVAAVSARFPGVITAIRKFPGEKVIKGEVLAIVESNDSLRPFELTAPQQGEVLMLTSSVGENVGVSDPIFLVGDLSSVWLDLIVPSSEFARFNIGQSVRIKNVGNQGSDSEGKVVFLSPLADSDSQTRVARAEMPNNARHLVPGLFVEAEVVLAERQVPVAVKKEALQTFRDWTVVFQKVGDTFEIAILTLGQSYGEWVEVIDGLKPGVAYVTRNSFVVKADVMKTGASHDH